MIVGSIENTQISRHYLKSINYEFSYLRSEWLHGRDHCPRSGKARIKTNSRWTEKRKHRETGGGTRLPFRIFSLDETDKLDAALNEVDFVLHCAGPFSITSKPMCQACLRTGRHYLDITGEIVVFEAMARLDEKAKAADIMIMPGVGFDVVPSDSLALHLKNRSALGDKSDAGFSRDGKDLARDTGHDDHEHRPRRRGSP